MVAPTEGSRLPARQVWTPPRLGKQRRGAVSLRQGPPRLSHAPPGSSSRGDSSLVAQSRVGEKLGAPERAGARRGPVRQSAGSRRPARPSPGSCAPGKPSRALLSAIPRPLRIQAGAAAPESGPWRAHPDLPSRTGDSLRKASADEVASPCARGQCARRCPWCWRSSPPSASLRLLLSVVLSPVPAMMSSMPGMSSPRNSP